MNRLMLLAIVMLVGVLANSQSTESPIKHIDVVRLSDTTVKAQEIYTRARLFFPNEYQSAKDVISFDDVNAFTIVGRGWIHIKSNNIAHKSVKLWHTLKIQCKDGRYRYELSEMKVEFVISGFYGGTQTLVKDYNEFVSSIESNRNERKRLELEEIWIKPINDLLGRLNVALNKSTSGNW